MSTDPMAVLKLQLMALGSKGHSFKEACMRAGISADSAMKSCGFTPEELQTFTASEEAAEAANKSTRVLNRALRLRKCGLSDQSICASENVTLNFLRETGFPVNARYQGGVVDPLFKSRSNSLGKLAAAGQVRRPINANCETSIRMFGSWDGVTPKDSLRKVRTAQHLNLWERQDLAKDKAVGMKVKTPVERDRSTSGELTNSPGTCSYNVNVKQNRNQRAVGIFTGDGHGPSPAGTDDVPNLKSVKDKLNKSVNIPELSDYSWDEAQRHVGTALEAIETFSKRMPVARAIEDICTRLPNQLAGFLIKRLMAMGKPIPDSVSYLMG